MTSYKSVVFVIAIALVVLAGGVLYLKRSSAPFQPEESAPVSEESEIKEAETLLEQSPETYVIRYTDSGYEPSSLIVKKGAVAVFKNESSAEMWAASAMHPTHAVYPSVGGCIGSTFDACRGFKPGEEWTFVFDAAGTWKYHDHLNPRYFGSIMVE